MTTLISTVMAKDSPSGPNPTAVWTLAFEVSTPFSLPARPSAPVKHAP